MGFVITKLTQIVIVVIPTWIIMPERHINTMPGLSGLAELNAVCIDICFFFLLCLEEPVFGRQAGIHQPPPLKSPRGAASACAKAADASKVSSEILECND